MMTDSKMIRFKKGRKAFQWAVGAAILATILYTLLYQFAPFSQYVNSLLSNAMAIAVSATCAALATLIVRRYSKDEPPRGIWTNLAMALCLWTLGEAVWAYYNIVSGEVGLSIADAFWLAGYTFFFTALFIQYHILFRPTPRQSRRAVTLTAISLILILAISTKYVVRFADMTADPETLIYVFYPTADLVIAAAALHLARRFRMGALSYLWLGLLVFVLADSMYAWLDFTGMYTWSIDEGNLLSGIADILYFAAYLAIALGYYAHWLLLQYGPIFNVKRKT